MKLFNYLLAGILCASAIAVSAQHRADPQKLVDPESFSMILLGDPQGYTKYDINQPLFDLCTAWIADNIEPLKIKAVLCTGDLVEQNDNNVLNRKMLNQTSREMWEAASQALKRLDNKVPYIIAAGNHDYGYKAAENGRTYFPDYIPFERNSTWRNICVSEFPNREGRASLENSAFEFDEPGWGKILVIAVEFVPRDEVLQWAKDLVNKPEYKNHKVIFITHSYLDIGNKRVTKDGYKISPQNSGQAIWEKLIYPSSNIRLVLCGHVGRGTGEYENNVAYRVDKNSAGKDVSQMTFNVQYVGGGPEGNGGDGWLRILEFMPDGKTIQFIEDYRKKGYLPEAVFNFIALLGWNPGGEDEIFSREELIKLFDENRLSKSPAAFDQKKLDWMSNDYIKNADFDKVFALCKPFLEEAGRLTDKAEKLVELYKPQMTAAEEIVPLTDLFFEDFPELTEAEKEVMAGETVPTVLKAFKAKLEAMSDDEFVVENIFPQIKAVQKETGIKGKNLFMPIRIAVSGEMHGPELPDTIFLLGREKSIKHIDQVLATL